jgi:hypothetical protein
MLRLQPRFLRLGRGSDPHRLELAAGRDDARIVTEIQSAFVAHRIFRWQGRCRLSTRAACRRWPGFGPTTGGAPYTGLECAQRLLVALAPDHGRRRAGLNP